MNTHTLFIPFLLATILLLGCNSNDRRITEQQKQIETLNHRLDSLSAENESLGSKLESMKSDQSWKDLLQSFNEIAYLTPGEEGYSIIRTNLGAITVSLKNVQPYANGSRVTLQFGNTLGATIDGLKAKVEWGSVDSKGSPKNETERSKEIAPAKSLAPGTWTNVSVVLDGISPIDLGFVRVKEVHHTGIRLKQE